VEKSRYKNNKTALDKNQVADGYIKKGFPESLPKSLFNFAVHAASNYNGHPDVYFRVIDSEDPFTNSGSFGHSHHSHPSHEEYLFL
jgi:hypothetical protein